MNSSNSRKQMSTPIKNAPPSLTHQYSNLRSDSKSKLPTLVPQGSTSNSPFGQPVEILPSNLFYLFLLICDRQAVLGFRCKASSKLCFIILLLHR